MAWMEFRGELGCSTPPTAHSELVISQRRILFPDDEVVIAEKRIGLPVRRLASRIMLRVLDSDTALIHFLRPSEPEISVGWAGHFTFHVNKQYEVQTIFRQDLVIWRPKNRLEGVLWVGENNEREHPLVMKPFRSYRESDQDDEAAEVIRKYKLGEPLGPFTFHSS